MGSNGFFGQIKGPFSYNVNIFTLIEQQCKSSIDYINKIGIQYPINYDLNINHNVPENNGSVLTYGDLIPFVEIGDGSNPAKTFSLGKTGMLELEDVNIRYISFISGNTDCYIDYQYIPNIQE